MKGHLVIFALLIHFFCATSAIAQVTKLTSLENFSENALGFSFAHRFDNRGEGLYVFGITFKGEDGSTPSQAGIFDPTFLIDVVLRNDPPSGEDSSGKALIIQFQRPVKRVAFNLGNGSPSTIAQISSFTAAGELLGTIEQDNIFEREGPLVGVETLNPEGISIVVIDYGEEEKAEQIDDMRIDFLEQHTFVRCIAQIGDGQAAGRRLSTIIQVQSLLARQSVMLTFYDSAAQPLVLSLDAQSSNTFAFELGPTGMKSFRTDGASVPVLMGYACVESLYPVAAQAIFRTTDESGQEIREASITGTTGKNDQTLTIEYDQMSGLNTGLALVNLGEAEASLFFRLSEGTDPVGGIHETERTTIPAGGHLPIFVNEIFQDFFEDLEGTFEGSVRITSLQRIVAVAVRTIDGFPVSSLPSGSWEP